MSISQSLIGRSDVAECSNSMKSTVAEPKLEDAPLPRRFPEEDDEDILRESSSRFVLFPIRYHEVSAIAERTVADLQIWSAYKAAQARCVGASRGQKYS